MSLEQDVERNIKKCEGYMGFSEGNGIIILCEAMAVALRLLLNIYTQGRRRG